MTHHDLFMTQFMMQNSLRVRKELGMKINVGKAKVMRTDKNVNIFLLGKTVQQVNSFKYFTTILT